MYVLQPHGKHAAYVTSGCAVCIIHVHVQHALYVLHMIIIIITIIIITIIIITIIIISSSSSIVYVCLYYLC